MGQIVCSHPCSEVGTGEDVVVLVQIAGGEGAVRAVRHGLRVVRVAPLLGHVTRRVGQLTRVLYRWAGNVNLSAQCGTLRHDAWLPFQPEYPI